MKFKSMSVCHELVSESRRFLAVFQNKMNSIATKGYPYISDELKVDSFSHAIHWLDAGIPMPLVVLIGATGVGKTRILVGLNPDNGDKPRWVRPSTTHVTGRLMHGLNLLADPEPSLMIQVDALPKETNWPFSGVLECPDHEFADPVAMKTSTWLKKRADFVVLITSPQRIAEELDYLSDPSILDNPCVFVLGNADICGPTEAGAIIQAWRLDLVRSGFDRPEIFIWPDESRKLIVWLESVASSEWLHGVRCFRLAREVRSLANEMDSIGANWSQEKFASLHGQWRSEIYMETENIAEKVMEGLDGRRMEMELFLEADLHKRLRGIMAFWIKYVAKGWTGSGLLTGGWRSVLGHVSLGFGKSEALCDQVSRLALEPAIDSSEVESHRDALVSRLKSSLVNHGIPVAVFDDSFRKISSSPWRAKLLCQSKAVLEEFEGRRMSSGGFRGLFKELTIGMANYFPPVFVLAAFSWPVILFIDPMGWKRTPQWFDLLILVACMVGLLSGLHGLLGMVMPFQWNSIRSELKSRLVSSMAREFEREIGGYCEKTISEIGKTVLDLQNLMAQANQLADQAEKVAESTGVFGAVIRAKGKSAN